MDTFPQKGGMEKTYFYFQGVSQAIDFIRAFGLSLSPAEGV